MSHRPTIVKPPPKVIRPSGLVQPKTRMPTAVGKVSGMIIHSIYLCYMLYYSTKSLEQCVIHCSLFECCKCWRLKVVTFIYRHLQGNPDQQRFTMRSGVLTGN